MHGVAAQPVDRVHDEDVDLVPTDYLAEPCKLRTFPELDADSAYDVFQLVRAIPELSGWHADEGSAPEWGEFDGHAFLVTIVSDHGLRRLKSGEHRPVTVGLLMEIGLCYDVDIRADRDNEGHVP